MLKYSKVGPADLSCTYLLFSQGLVVFKLVSGALQLLPELVQFCLQHLPPLPLVCQLGLYTGQLPGIGQINVKTEFDVKQNIVCMGMILYINS